MASPKSKSKSKSKSNATVRQFVRRLTICIAALSLLLVSTSLVSSQSTSQQQQAAAAAAAAGKLNIPSRPLHYHKSVFKLMDKTFERETQASTGQTTGSWLIWFHARGDSTSITGDMPEDEFWQEQNIVLGSVNADLVAGETMERFKLTKDHLPLFLFLHRGKLYRYPLAKKYHWDELVDFCLGGYKLVKEEKVPPPMSEVTRFFRKLAGPAGLPLRIGLVTVFVVFILYTSLISYFTGHNPAKDKLA